jgi:hypothetical protein
MSEESKRALGAVVYESDKMMFIASMVTNKESDMDTTKQCARFGNKNRWAYLAVGYKESEILRKQHSDSESLLKALRAKYEPYLKESILSQEGISSTEIKDCIMKKAGSVVYLEQSQVCATTSLEDVLYVHKMTSHMKKLKEIHTKKSPRKTRITLSLTRQEAQRLLKDDHVFAIVAFAYGYTGENKALRVIKVKEAQVAFVPRTRLECGVFFDGTNNNMHNTEMRLAYEQHFDLKSQMISGELERDEKGWESKILDPKIPESEILPLIFSDLQKSMKAVYGKKRQSEEKYDDGVIFGIGQNDVSADCDAIYKYFRNSKMQEVLSEIQDIQNDDMFTNTQRLIKTKAKKEEFKLTQQTVAYIEKEILISGKDSSYTGALSNVAHLYKYYDTDVTKTTHKDADLFECFRDKIYITGAGTYSDNREGNHEKDDLFLGQALAIGDAGVRAKVNGACQALHEKVSALDTNYVDTLVLDVFGFSRGAAEARHFVSKLCEGLECSFERTVQDKKRNDYIEYELSKKGENLYAHIIKEKASEKDKVVIDKIVFRFVGVFDTVPHEGLFQGNDAKDLGLKIENKKVSKLVHLTAKDEFRYNFDLVSVFAEHTKDEQGEKEQDHFLEKEFFGAHSDVGGGYRDNISEEIQLPTQIRRLHTNFENKDIYDERIVSKIKKWNRRHHWIKSLDDSMITNIKRHKDMGTADGFYIKKRVYVEQEKTTVRYKIYMYRSKVDSEYAQVPFEYMYKRVKEVLPMKQLSKLTYRDMGIDKELVIKADIEYYKAIKSQFFHHSSSVGIAHKANRGNENILYGKRTVHYV